MNKHAHAGIANCSGPWAGSGRVIPFGISMAGVDGALVAGGARFRWSSVSIGLSWSCGRAERLFPFWGRAFPLVAHSLVPCRSLFV